MLTESKYSPLEEAKSFLERGSGCGDFRQPVTGIFERNVDVTQLFQESRKLTQLLKGICEVGECKSVEDEESITNVLLQRASVLSQLSRIQQSSERAKMFLEHCNQNYSLLFQRITALPTPKALRDHALVCIASGLHGFEHDSTTALHRGVATFQASQDRNIRIFRNKRKGHQHRTPVYPLSATIMQPRSLAYVTACILQSILKLVQPLHFEIYTDYVRSLLLYALSLQLVAAKVSNPRLVPTMRRCLAQAVGVCIGLLQYHVAPDLLARFNLRLPMYSATQTFADAFRQLGSASEAWLEVAKPMAQNASPFSDDAKVSFDQDKVAPYVLFSLAAKAAWAFVDVGGTVGEVQAETEKIMRWITEKTGGPVPKPDIVCAKSGHACTDGRCSTCVRDGQCALWGIILCGLSLARANTVDAFAFGEMSLELHDATIEYLSGFATCNRPTGVPASSTPLKQNNTVHASTCNVGGSKRKRDPESHLDDEYHSASLLDTSCSSIQHAFADIALLGEMSPNRLAGNESLISAASTLEENDAISHGRAAFEVSGLGSEALSCSILSDLPVSSSDLRTVHPGLMVDQGDMLTFMEQNLQGLEAALTSLGVEVRGSSLIDWYEVVLQEAAQYTTPKVSPSASPLDVPEIVLPPSKRLRSGPSRFSPAVELPYGSSKIAADNFSQGETIISKAHPRLATPARRGAFPVEDDSESEAEASKQLSDPRASSTLASPERKANSAFSVASPSRVLASQPPPTLTSQRTLFEVESIKLMLPSTQDPHWGSPLGILAPPCARPRGSRVRWSNDVLAVEGSRRRLRLVSLEELPYGPDGRALSNTIDLVATHNALATSSSEFSASPMLPAPSPICINGVNARIPAGSPLTIRLSGCPSPEPIQLSSVPILPAGAVPSESMHFAKLPGAWPLAMPSARCIPVSAGPHSALCLAFEHRVSELRRVSRMMLEMSPPSYRSLGSPISPSTTPIEKMISNAAPTVHIDSDDCRDALVSSLKLAYFAAVKELFSYSKLESFAAGIVKHPFLAERLHVMQAV